MPRALNTPSPSRCWASAMYVALHSALHHESARSQAAPIGTEAPRGSGSWLPGLRGFLGLGGADLLPRWRAPHTKVSVAKRGQRVGVWFPQPVGLCRLN